MPMAQIYLHCHQYDLQLGVQHTRKDAQVVADWCTTNKIDLNLSKFKVMILGSPPNISKIDFAALPVIALTTPLQYVSKVKSLGDILSSTLNFSSHTKTVSSKVYASLSPLRFFKKTLNKDLRVNLVQSLLLPHFDQ